MAKAFLSHSSIDKKRYVSIVHKYLGQSKCIYDEVSFEEGMKNYEEILSGLDRSDLFVLFISNDSLDSEWVQKEILNSYDKLKKGELQRIFPIIIDENITYKDHRIPDWMRKEYNIQYISRPKLAARRINQRLIEISWQYHPLVKEKNNLFVGRNQQISEFEERFDSFDLNAPNCVFVCGLEKIGRKSFNKKALIKCSIIKESYEFTKISLDINESVEDFILKLYDLGFSEEIDIKNLMFKTIDEKLSLINQLLIDINKAKEIIQVIDNGCIVSPSGELADWFDSIINSFTEHDDYLYFNIISKYRFYKAYNLNKKIYHINLSELDPKERIGLLKRYANLFEIVLDEEAIDIFKNTLQGFPEQIFYCIDIIRAQGINYLKENSYLIVEYNTEKVKELIKQYEENTESLNLLLLLSEFDFISIDFLNEFISLSENYIGLIKEFIINGICEHLGASKEYIRLNDGIRDYISRTRTSMPREFKDIIKKHTEAFVNSIEESDNDLSEVVYTIRNSLKNGIAVPNEYLIPSHFLKTINELYDKGKKYHTIIELADRVLENSTFMDKHILNEITYMLCLSLARIGSSDRFFKEVGNLKKEDRYYLLGFYFRLSGNIGLAKENIEKFLNIKKNSIKGRRELVQIYIDIEDFENAFSYAKEIYDYEKLNPYNILAYIRCLFKVKTDNYKLTIEELINDLKLINTDISNEMYYSVKAEYISTFENDRDTALAIIDECIGRFPDTPFPLLTKIEICEKFRLPELMVETLHKLKAKNPKANTYNNTINILEVKSLALSGKLGESLRLIDSKLKNKLPKENIDKLIEKLKQY
ncbi:toll/interleukin-1 receptor domain-containing protein [Flavobacterium sp. UBA7680]|uniref:toll/interleukin-1 receptor domain-containing protein n=1 Tax=Flavobacterium sp. UBA7680 TaxID=1946559 RepID=UPI0025BAE974|nr:toll/interleukin-1 receptor domain-containing protein [Flavobacterium sp. UBA7680]